MPLVADVSQASTRSEATTINETSKQAANTPQSPCFNASWCWTLVHLSTKLSRRAQLERLHGLPSNRHEIGLLPKCSSRIPLEAMIIKIQGVPWTSWGCHSARIERRSRASLPGWRHMISETRVSPILVVLGWKAGRKEAWENGSKDSAWLEPEPRNRQQGARPNRKERPWCRGGKAAQVAGQGRSSFRAALRFQPRILEGLNLVWDLPTTHHAKESRRISNVGHQWIPQLPNLKTSWRQLFH